MTRHAGLHEGLKALSDGGTPPKLLIIDDGWQCTDVDVPLRKPMSSRMLMIEEMRESMEGTQDEFIDAELKWLARSAKDLPPSSSAGVLTCCMGTCMNSFLHVHMHLSCTDFEQSNITLAINESAPR